MPITLRSFCDATTEDALNGLIRFLSCIYGRVSHKPYRSPRHYYRGCSRCIETIYIADSSEKTRYRSCGWHSVRVHQRSRTEIQDYKYFVPCTLSPQVFATRVTLRKNNEYINDPVWYIWKTTSVHIQKFVWGTHSLRYTGAEAAQCTGTSLHLRLKSILFMLKLV